MSIFDQEVESPHRLADVEDPCTESYYPRWSARGMRSVRCTRPAKATLFNPAANLRRRVCGVHLRRHANDGRWVVENRLPYRIEGGTAR